ncbi:MAG: hypothetical protein GF308_00210 [Candidatus Heimdallarchaeota archaeon]|nr:hypothetical protein [Candidatus Heimdallarchaeota archaeon]
MVSIFHEFGITSLKILPIDKRNGSDDTKFGRYFSFHEIFQPKNRGFLPLLTDCFIEEQTGNSSNQFKEQYNSWTKKNRKLLRDSHSLEITKSIFDEIIKELVNQGEEIVPLYLTKPVIFNVLKEKQNYETLCYKLIKDSKKEYPFLERKKNLDSRIEAMVRDINFDKFLRVFNERWKDQREYWKKDKELIKKIAEEKDLAILKRPFNTIITTCYLRNYFLMIFIWPDEDVDTPSGIALYKKVNSIESAKKTLKIVLDLIELKAIKRKTETIKKGNKSLRRADVAGKQIPPETKIPAEKVLTEREIKKKIFEIADNIAAGKIDEMIQKKYNNRLDDLEREIQQLNDRILFDDARSMLNLTDDLDKLSNRLNRLKERIEAINKMLVQISLIIDKEEIFKELSAKLKGLTKEIEKSL